MGNNVNDTLQLVRRILIDKVSLQNYVSGRIYTTHFIDYDSKTTPMPLVVLEFAGGTANYGMNAQRVSLRVYSYSDKSSSEAAAIYNLVYDTLNGGVLKHSGIELSGYGYEVSRPHSGFNDQVKGWYYAGTFIINSAG